ncbi:MAG: histidine phosphatase family protein [Clostridia bacterium]|nr:histidine phosphatase family protein [Clostridia bacterium]
MIYIVRHGQTNWNLEGRYQGRIDIELNEKGIGQAEKIREELKDIKFDKIFASPLKRAYRTAEIISNGDIIKDERLIERCNGELEGKLKEDCTDAVDFTDPNEKRFGIEPLPLFRKRITDFLDDIVEKYKEKDILVVTHAGVSIYIKCYFEGEPYDNNYSKLKLKNCEVLKINND